MPPEVKFRERKSVKLKSFTGADVDALYFNSTKDLINARNILKENNIICYESDVHPEERYLMERFIYGSIHIEGNYSQKGSIKFFRNPVIRPAEYIPTFKVLSMDIETGRDGTVYSIGLHLSGSGKEYKEVLMRSESIDNLYSEDYITYCSSEINLLREFLNKIQILDPDIIIGWHVIGFDLQFLQRRFEVYNLPFKLGRLNSIPSIRQTNNKSWICDIEGRIVIDGPPSLRGAFYSFESFKLENVANVLLGTGKDITGEGKVEEIERRFREDKKALAHYNLLDCTLVTEIFEKVDLISLVYTRAITCGLTMDRIGMSVASFDYFMLPMVHRKGLVAPDLDDIIYNEAAKGGLVFIEEPGFYESIIVLDFKSLYPSIIRTFFIDPVSRLKSDVDTITTPVNINFSKSVNVLPDFIKKLMDQRENAKKNDNQHLSQAIKILMNSFYGVMGTSGSRFYHNDLPKAITGTGQWLLSLSREFIESHGYKVIYGDTDSLFVQLKKKETSEYSLYANRLVTEVNTYLKKKLLKDFKVESRLELEYEKYFSKFFLPGLRGSKEGAKKRYVGLLKKDMEESLTFTGMEFVRSDWTPLAKEFQFNLFSKIFNNEEIESYINGVIKELKNGKLDDKLVYKKRLTKKAKEYTKNVPPQVKAALKLDPEGSIAGSIEYIITGDGPTPVKLDPKNPDYNHYIDKQLEPIANSILPFIQKDFETIVFKKQPELF